jgi:hypothetical protein
MGTDPGTQDHGQNRQMLTPPPLPVREFTSEPPTRPEPHAERWNIGDRVRYMRGAAQLRGREGVVLRLSEAHNHRMLEVYFGPEVYLCWVDNVDRVEAFE